VAARNAQGTNSTKQRQRHTPNEAKPEHAQKQNAEPNQTKPKQKKQGKPLRNGSQWLQPSLTQERTCAEGMDPAPALPPPTSGPLPRAWRDARGWYSGCCACWRGRGMEPPPWPCGCDEEPADTCRKDPDPALRACPSCVLWLLWWLSLAVAAGVCALWSPRWRPADKVRDLGRDRERIVRSDLNEWLACDACSALVRWLGRTRRPEPLLTAAAAAVAAPSRAPMLRPRPPRVAAAVVSIGLPAAVTATLCWSLPPRPPPALPRLWEEPWRWMCRCDDHPCVRVLAAPPSWRRPLWWDDVTGRSPTSWYEVVSDVGEKDTLAITARRVVGVGVVVAAVVGAARAARATTGVADGV